jgi:glucosamine--fructose-6-phosphate aminotransferase (isomerizing)
LVLALSQSGRSPDLLASVAAARAAGATILALCNTPDAPLIAAADLSLALRAGIETSVAATKSYLATLAALIRLVAAWTSDAALASAIDTLPALMDQSWALDWSAALPLLESAEHLYVVGRGLGLGAAQETALKCKETCGLHAEAFSSAELRHGPYTLLGPGFPALLLAQPDATRAGVEALGGELARRGVPVMIAGAQADGAVTLPAIQAAAEIAPILLVQSAYRLIATLAIRRGFDPDHPAHLRKVTETL